MNEYAWAGQFSALVAIVGGILICFCGYRLLKVTLGIIGFIAGAYTGWEFGVSAVHASAGITLGCTLIGGLVGMALCLWLYFLGIFLVGATAGTVVAAAFFDGTGQPAQPIAFLATSIVFGLIALVAQKSMIIVSTAFSGAYLITAGFWPSMVGAQNAAPIWLHPSHTNFSGALVYAPLVMWLVLGLAGVSFQFRTHRRKVEAPDAKS